MKLIIGGAHQGKLDFARQTCQLKESDIFYCSDTKLDYTKPCIYALEEYALACVRENVDPIAEMKANEDKWKDSIIICRDIFCGVVPLDPELRRWRQVCGRLCQYLTANAQSVSRIFCGLEQRLK